MTIVFYDINLKNLYKYISDIVDLMILNSDIEVILLYDEFNEEGFNYYKDKRCEIIKNSSITYNSIKVKLKYLKPDIFMVNAQRLSDSAFIVVARKMGIKTGMIQHGMYIPFMKREKFYLVKKTLKTLKYFMYSQVIAKAINRGRIEVFKKFLETFVNGRMYKDAIDFYKDVNVDFVFVYGIYWKEYHHNVFGYTFDQQSVIGYHELNKIIRIRKKIFEEDTICYIAQTLVEDGRLPRSIMEKFLSSLLELEKNKKIYIKLHPRSDKTLFTNKRFILLATEIPNCETYLGHYSSLIALVGHLDGQVFLFEFKDHIIPFYFMKFAFVTNDNLKLLKMINKGVVQDNKSEKIEEYFAKGYDSQNNVNLIYKKLNEESKINDIN